MASPQDCSFWQLREQYMETLGSKLRSYLSYFFLVMSFKRTFLSPGNTLTHNDQLVFREKLKGASVWDWRTQYPGCVGRGAYCNAAIICAQQQRLEHIEGKHSWPPECLQTVGLCFTPWPFNFWRNARRDVSVKIRSEESVTIGYHSPGGRAVGCPLFGESSLLTGCKGVALQMILRWQRACLLLGGGGATVK